MNILRLLSIAILFYSCAVIQAPSGGPKDKTPPEIADFTPENYTRNYDGETIELEFSEYLNRSDVVKSIRINPPVKFDFKWRARKLIIEFQESLAEETTYSMQLGTGFSDLSGNKPSSAFELVFSTGEKLDSLRISGTLDFDKPEGLKVYLWKLDNTDSDSTLFIEDPDYITELGGNGEFSFGALKDLKHRLLIFEDVNQNKIFDDGFERFAVPQNDIVASNDPEIIKMKLSNAKDIKGPSLVSAIASSYESVDFTFSENILADSLSISISDSISGEEYQIRSFFYLDSILGKKIRVITNKMRANQAAMAEVFALDTTNKPIVDSTNTAYIYPPDRELKKDEIIKFTDLKDSSKLKSVKLDYIINFPIPPREFNSNIVQLYKSSDSSEIGKMVDALDSRTYLFSNIDLEPESWYFIKVDLSSQSGIFNNNFKDTTFITNFQTGQKPVFSKISGLIADSSLQRNGMILKIFNEENIYYTDVSESGWTVEKILPGNYSAEIFWDTNGNRLLDLGSVVPYEFSERYLKFNNTIEIKERWDLEDIILSY